MNQEGMDDRYYFSDWGSCTCTEDYQCCDLNEEVDDEEDEN